MLKLRTKWSGDRGARAIKRVTEIEASIASLANEDLLDFADIFVREPTSALKSLAAAEMQKRNINL